MAATQADATIAQANKDYWESRAADPAGLHGAPWMEELTGQIRSFLAGNLGFLKLTPASTGRMLDYACAGGTPSQALLPAVPRLQGTGLDMAPGMLERYRAALGRRGVAAARIAVVEVDLVR